MRRKIGLVLGGIAVCMFATVANADILSYEMDKSLDDASYASDPFQWVKHGDGYGDLVAGDFNPPEDAGYNKIGQGNDPTAVSSRFSDTGSYGNDDWGISGFAQSPGSTGWTVDMRAWGEENTEGATARRSGGMSNASNAGRRIRIEPRNAANDSLRIVFVSAGPVATFYIDPTPDATNPTLFHMIRFVLPNDGSGIYLYDLERWDAATGWLLVGVCTDIGGTHSAPGAGGLTLNAASGGQVTNSKFSADWVRIDTENALGAMDPILPEPVTLALLGLGALPMLRRRR